MELIKNIKFKIQRKHLIILGAILILVLLLWLIYFLFSQKPKEIISPKPAEKEESLAEKQLKELDKLRQKMGVQLLSEKEKQAQIKELEALRKEANIKPLSQEQIQKPAQDGRGSLNEIERQLEELEKLHLAQWVSL